MPLPPPTIEELRASALSKFITFAANDGGYSGSNEFVVTVVCHFFLNANSEASKEDNPNWYQA